MSRGPAVVLYGLSSNPTREVSLNDNHKTHLPTSLLLSHYRGAYGTAVYYRSSFSLMTQLVRYDHKPSQPIGASHR